MKNEATSEELVIKDMGPAVDGAALRELAELAELAERVAQTHEEQLAAQDDEVKAEAELLGKIVMMVKPALRALSSRLPESYRLFWPDSVSTDTEKTFQDLRGVRLDGDGPSEDYPRANRGSYEGRDLYLLVDGTFVLVEYEGTWTRRQGESNRWDVTNHPMTLENVVKRYKVEALSRAIFEALEQQDKGKAKDRTKSAKERATKVRAVSELLWKS